MESPRFKMFLAGWRVSRSRSWAWRPTTDESQTRDSHGRWAKDRYSIRKITLEGKCLGNHWEDVGWCWVQVRPSSGLLKLGIQRKVVTMTLNTSQWRCI